MYNDGVLCRWRDERVCARCGWKPEVAERRKAKLYGENRTDCRAPQDGARNDNDLKGEQKS